MTTKYHFQTRFLAVAGVALMLTACSSKDGKARNDAAKTVSETAASIQKLSLGAAYPTPMTSQQSADFTSLAGSLPDWLTDDQLLRSLRAHGAKEFKPLKESKREFEQIIQKSSANQGTAQQQSAQRALRCDANLGLSAIQLEEAERLDVAMRPGYALGHTMLTAVLDLDAMIASAQAFDPGPQRRQYDEMANAARASLQTHQNEARTLERQISDLQKRVDNELSAANSLNEQAVTQRENALNAPLNERLAQLEDSKTTARRSGDHQVAAARLEAQLDLLRPDLARYEMLAAQDRGQITDMDRALALLDEQSQDNARQIAELRRDMGQAASAFGAHLDPLIEAFQVELMASFDAAADAAQAAASDAQRGTGQLPAVTARQLLGLIHWRRSMALNAMIQLVQRAVDHASVLGRSSSDRALLQNLKSMEAEAASAAQEALREALDSINNAPSSGGEMDQRLSSLRASLVQSISYLTGEAVAPVRDLSDVPDVVPMDEPSAVTTDASGPRELLRTAQRYERDGELMALAGLYYSESPQFEAAMNRMRPSAAAQDRLDKACRSQLGSGMVDILKRTSPLIAQAIGSQGLLGSGILNDLDVDSLEIRFDSSGMTAWVDNAPALSKYNMVDSGGQWYFEMDSALVDLLRMMPDEVVSAQTELLNDLAEQVENGAISTEQAFADAITAAMQGAQPGGDGEFGPGGNRRRDRGGGGG